MTIRSLEIQVEGMRCEGCERTVRTALTRIEGMRDVKADHQAKRVQVRFDPQLIDEQRVRAQIEQLGYQVTKEAD